MPKNIRVYSGTSNPQLAQEIADYLEMPLGDIEISRFPDGEIFVQYKENIRRADVYIIQPTSSPTNDNLMELLIMIDAAKRASAARITAVLPFYGYARQDRKDRPRVPITSKLVANLLVTAGVDRIITMDLHSQQIQGFFDIPVDHLYAAPVIVPYLKEKLGKNAVVVAPDSGSVKMANAYAMKLDAGLAVVAKRRIDAESVESSHLVGDVAGRTCVITDDLTSTAGTLLGAAEQLKKAGAGDIYVAVSHCLLNDAGVERIKNSEIIKEMVTTNGVKFDADTDNKVIQLSIAPLLGEAIRRINEGRSVSTLFNYS
ncbi:ribose-phosphate pyrophosphokinase [Lentisphaerota bacterium WC36G]|nr:ribose-phosphate pyrophosphokinase [Lentisphaerae bacterium WC36]